MKFKRLRDVIGVRKASGVLCQIVNDMFADLANMWNIFRFITRLRGVGGVLSVLNTFKSIPVGRSICYIGTAKRNMCLQHT
jgi:acid phosphatase family membrane protein YuiD